MTVDEQPGKTSPFKKSLSEKGKFGFPGSYLSLQRLAYVTGLSTTCDTATDQDQNSMKLIADLTSKRFSSLVQRVVPLVGSCVIRFDVGHYIPELSTQ